MKKILYYFMFVILFSFWINITNADYIDKNAVKTSQWTFDVVVKGQNAYMNIKQNSIVDWTNTTSYNWYFLSKDINNKDVDLWSYWQPAIKVGSGFKYLLSSFYMFSSYNQDIKIKSFVKWDNQQIKDSLGTLYTTYNPTYLWYVAISTYTWTYNLNDFMKSYIDNLSYSDRVNLIQDIDNNWCINILSNKIKICGFQKNPTKLTTEQTWSGYQNINWYENDTSFLSNNINIWSWVNTLTVWFVRDLYDWFNWLDSYNSLTDWIQITFWIEWGYIFPAFVWYFKNDFITTVDAYLKLWYSYNSFIWNLLKAYKASWKEIGDLFTRDYINWGEEDKLYKYWIGYIYLWNKITDNNNNNNYTYYYNTYLVNGSNLYMWENFDSNQKAQTVIAKTNNKCLFSWTNDGTDYVSTTHKLPNNTSLHFTDSCLALPDTTSSFWNLTFHKFYFWNNPSDNYKIYFHSVYNNKPHTIFIASNNPLIFDRVYVPNSIHSSIYVPNKIVRLQNISENVKINNDNVAVNDYVDNKSLNQGLTWYIISNTLTWLVLDKYWVIQTKTANGIFNVNTSDVNFLKSLALYLHLNIQDLSLSWNSTILSDRNIVTKQLNLKKQADWNIEGQYYFTNGGNDYDLYFQITTWNKINFNVLTGHTDYSCNFIANYWYKLDNNSYSVILSNNCNFSNVYDSSKPNITLPFQYIVSTAYYKQDKIYSYNTYYWNNDLTVFKNQNFQKLIDLNLLNEDQNTTNQSSYNFISLYSENKDNILNRIAYINKPVPHKDFIALANNKDSSNLIYNLVNSDNIASSNYIPDSTFYKNYIENLINYNNSLPWTIYYVLDNSSHLNDISLNKDYYISTYIVPNFNYAKTIKASIVGWDGTYIKWLKIDCNWQIANWTNITTLNYNNYLITWWVIKDCKVILNVRATNATEKKQLQNSKISIKIQIADNKNTITKTISYTIFNPNTVNTNWLADIFLFDDSGNISKNITTKYNWFGAYVRYDIPDKSKKIKYVKISLELNNSDFELLPNPLLDKNPWYIAMITNLIHNNNETLIRNKTHYDLIIPYDDNADNFKIDWYLNFGIQLNKDLSKVKDREWKIKLNIKYVYIDWTIQNLTDEAKFKVLWADWKDYITDYVYNLQNKDDPLYTSTNDSNGLYYRYWVWEINYFHISKEIQAQDSSYRVPANYQWDEDWIWNWFGNWTTYWDNLWIYARYGLNYFPSYKGSNYWGYSIEDTYNNKVWGYRYAYTPNQNWYSVNWVCSTYYSRKQIPPTYDDGRGYGWFKTIKITGSLKMHINRLQNWWQWWDFFFPVVLYNSDAYTNVHKFITTYSYSYYQTSPTHNINSDKNILLPRLVLAPEFKWMVDDIELQWQKSITPTFHTVWTNSYREIPFTITIKLKELNSNNAIKNNSLYKLLEEWDNKKLFTLQIPMVILWNYNWLDYNILNQWKWKNIGKYNNFMYEFLSSNQKMTLVKMRLSYQKYIRSQYSKGYLYSRNYDHWRRCCSKSWCHKCWCIIDSQGSSWIDQWAYEYLFGYSVFNKISEVGNNYIIRVFRPSEKYNIIGNWIVKWTPSNLEWNRITVNNTNLPSELKTNNQTQLDNNKQLSIFNYIMKNKDFAKNTFENYSYYNLKDILELDNWDKNNKWQVYYYKDAENLSIEWNSDIKYKGKKIIIVDGDLFVNSNILPNNKNKDYLIVVVLWNLYINANAEYLDWGLIVKWNYILLDWEKTLLNHWPVIINWKVFNYRNSQHSRPDLSTYFDWKLTEQQEKAIRSVMKESLVFLNDGRFIKIKLIIKKIFSDKKF